MEEGTTKTRTLDGLEELFGDDCVRVNVGFLERGSDAREDF